ncbi:hypothetical protein [Duganella violaceipulchra]|uniref:Uncharacterized protein n=1 Tax=Duganella violaceipulchra TaxID=2849652 RepID=A0AA41H9T6_9BURK|nr:hypothetical protein [Duganella violaceicalia]MBV6323385.1 hypothetical protein [Duganella violaceicalia]MCP2007661.1 hypothetical protein [Duganella violaceicalia]
MSAHPVPGKSKSKTKATIALPYWVAEFALIRTAVLVAVACVTISLTALLVSGWKLGEADERLEQAQRTRDVAYARFAHVDNEKRDIRNFQPRYIELRDRGLIGAERRLEWVDIIRQSQERRKLLPLSYEIEPQQVVRLESALDLGDYQLHGSRMRLHMDLLHEMDLFNFLDDLRLRSFFAVQDCAIKRLGRAAGAVGGPTLGADCTLNWITLDTAPKAEPAPATRRRAP